MNTQDQLRKHPRRVIAVALAILLVVALAVFHQSIIDGFPGAPVANEEEVMVPSRTPEAAGVSVPELQPQEFDAETRARLRTAFEAYEEARVLLAQDTVIGLTAQTDKMRVALEAAATNQGDERPAVKTYLHQAANAAKRPPGSTF